MKNEQDFKYILTIIDLYTKYAWAIPLKNKTGNTIKSSFENYSNKNLIEFLINYMLIMEVNFIIKHFYMF